MPLTFGPIIDRPRRQRTSRPARVAGMRVGPFTPEEDATLIARYATITLAQIAQALGRSVRSVESRSRRLIRRGQLRARDRAYQPYWTQAEIDYLLDHRGYLSDAELARRLGRTEMAVLVKGKRLRVSQKSNWLSARQVAEILGVETHKPLRLHAWGVLRMKRSVVQAGPHMAWRCEIRELERFLREESAWYDPRRVQEEPWRGIARRAHSDPWLTGTEAARVVGLSQEGFRRYLRRGEIAAMRVPGVGSVQWRVRRSVLSGFRPKRPELVGHRGGNGGVRRSDD